MCGIIGYVGHQDAFPILEQGLRRLEYRGYDSFGFATQHEGTLHITKSAGKISGATLTPLPGSIGIAHTRWATHGGVTDENAHPHVDCSGSIAVVHNGIIENFQALRAELEKKGHSFSSGTDTEIIAHLIEEQKTDFVEAVRKAACRLAGRFAIVAEHAGDKLLVGVRRGSPLIVGTGKDELFVASDIPAFLTHTKTVMYIDDGEFVVLSTEPKFFSIETGEPVTKRRIEVSWDAADAEKGDYPHFMIKEIMEQKETIQRAIHQDDNEIQRIADAIKNAYGTFFIGCGTAAKVCQTAEYLFSRIAQRHVNFVPASEFASHEHFLKENTLVIAVSQSGETADVLEAVETAKKKGAKVIAIVNVTGSSLTRIADTSFLINAGPEQAVASTKATTAQLALVMMLAYATAGKLDEGRRLLVDTAGMVNDMLNPRYMKLVEGIAKQMTNKRNAYIIGRGLNFPMALEAAIKIMEVSYVHAQGFAAGELKHGPIALIQQGEPVIAIIPQDETHDAMISNVMEVKARGGFVIGVSPKNNPEFDAWIRVPDARNASPIVSIIPIQILAYYLGVARGCDVDKPRNLAKSVTVK
ncbi:MAG: glutamine--fructose-6-phosphate transaminase (isomerizing) [Nanoarchaeota archaeon]|nr:glutamine--fructose-6-phosphate transaminase (isomerizing) [Nanoarchaeota archaeon]